MKTRLKRLIFKILLCIFVILAISACSAKDNLSSEKVSQKETSEESSKELPEETTKESSKELPEETTKDVSEKMSKEPLGETSNENKIPESEVIEADWSGYFNALKGAAVLYDTSNESYTIYNPELAGTRRSPCSTFKIISSLIALENGIIEADSSVRTWSGEVFWNENWNHDIDFAEAFRTSCVWYFREVIDEIGVDRVQTALDKLQYGNCDISDWEGRLNTNNNNRALTGFWIESSLQISPKEQVEVMERIFGSNTEYSEDTRNRLEQVMMISEQNTTGVIIFGKTGMGMAEGVVVDAWFTGFAKTQNGNVYFCVYLEETEDMDVSSTIAKEIAIQIVTDYCGEKNSER